MHTASPQLIWLLKEGCSRFAYTNDEKMRLNKLSAGCWYMFAGVLFGLAFPLCCMFFLAVVGQVDLSSGLFSAVRQAHDINVLFYVIDTAPVFLGLFARFAGVRQDRINGFNSQLKSEVSEKTQSLWAALKDARQAHEQVLHMAHHDPLTGLANRTLFRQRLEQALTNASTDERSLALVFIDIDHFKSVNDELGHDIGDALLCEIATRLLSNVSFEDTVARVGGDEFVVVLASPGRTDNSQDRLSKLLAAIEAPMTLAGREVAVTASLGVSFFPEDGAQADLLIGNADKAMYRVKRSGRGAYQLFDSQLEATAGQACQIDSEPAHATERNGQG